MDRYITKRQLTARRGQKKTRLRRVLLLMLGTAFIGSAVFFVYQRQQSPHKSMMVSSWYSQMMTWVTEKRGGHLPPKTEVVAKHTATAQNDVEPQIHFEFYTALPNMQSVGTKTLPAPTNTTVIADADVLEQELSDAVQQSRKEP